MARFKAGDLVVCVDNGGCQHLSTGKQYEVARGSGNYIEVCDDSGRTGVCYFSYRFKLPEPFVVDGCVKCVNATGSDLTEGRFYTVRDITDGGALILHGNDSRPYRRDRFELADNSEWVKQTIREKDAAQKEFEAKTLTIESADLVTLSPPVNPAGWDIEIDDSNPASPAVRMRRRSFQVGDTIAAVESLCIAPWTMMANTQWIVSHVSPDGRIRVIGVHACLPVEKFRLVKRADQ